MATTSRAPRHVALALACALDEDDWAAARSLLADDCEYHLGGQVVRGADAIVASYRTNSEKARRRLDRVAYASELERADASRATVLFVDRLEHAGLRHEFRCRQTFTLNAGGRVARIDHAELQREREALEAFFRRAGVAWNEV